MESEPGVTWAYPLGIQPGGENQPEADHQILPLFNEQVDHLDHLVKLKSVNLIKMLNLFNSIKIFNLINLFTFLGQGGQPGRMQQGRVGVTGILDTPLGVDNVPVGSTIPLSQGPAP